MKKLFVIMIVSFLIFGLTLNAKTKEESIVRDPTGLAPRQLVNSAENNRVTQPVITRDPDYQVYAYNAYDPTSTVPQGPVTFVLNDPAGLTSLAATSSSDFIAGGCWIADEETWYGSQYGGGLYSIDYTTGAMTYIAATTESFMGIEYDDASGIMYGTDGTSLYTIDWTTGATTLIGSHNVAYTMIGIAGDGEGNMYGVTVDFSLTSDLYSIDLSTGNATSIGNTGGQLLYAQDLAFDKDDGVLYAAAYFGDGTPPGLYSIDVNTAAMTAIGDFPNGMEVSGFAIPYTLAEDDAPAAVSDLVVTPDAGGALLCDLEWVNPDLTFAGDPLTELLETRVYREGVLIYTNSGPTIGAPDGYTDVLPSAGMYSYSVSAYNSIGEGPSVSAVVWVGEDVPDAVTDLELTDVSTGDLIAQLDWTNPTTGYHGGYFAGILGYDIVRSDGTPFVVTGSTTSWQDDSIIDAGVYSYTITPFNGSGSGPSTTSAQVGIGVSIVQVGNGEVGDYQIPINLYYMDSMTEVVYLQEWIGSDMLINTVSLHAATTSSMTDAFNLEIWLGETAEDDLSAGWIDGTNMTQVFDGTLDVPAGDSWVNIPLDSAFEYTYSGNLVMMIIRDDDEYYSTADLWWCTESNTQFRTRFDYNDDSAAQHYSAMTGPFTSTYEKTLYPDVRFYWSPLEHGDVQGVVTDSGTSNPINGAEVYVGAFGPVMTNAMGEYLLEDVVIGTQEVTAFKDGYYNFMGSVDVLTNQVIQYDFTMDPNLFGTLDGTVTDSDTGNPLVGAEINAVSAGGYTYDAVTNGTGYYNIPNVVAETYDVSCSFPDYPTGWVEDVVIIDEMTTTINFALEGYTYWNDFENNDGGLLSNDANGWQWGALTSGPMAGYSGTNGWGTVIGGDYPTNSNFTLDTPTSYMINSPAAMLEFWHWYDIEASWDGGNVKISTDGGSSWNVIVPLTGYTGVANSSNPLNGEEIFTGHVQGFWELAQFDLSGYVGQSVMFRWHFGSDSSVQYPGWYIDDVAISGGGMPVDPGYIEGTVVIADGMGDVEDVIVSAGGESTNPAANGTYSIEIQPGTYDVTATLDGYGAEMIEDVVVTEGNSTTGVNFTLFTGSGDIVIAATKLDNNYPNPFNPITKIVYSIKEPGNVTIEVYNIKGQLVKTLVNEEKETGIYSVLWNSKDNSNKSVSSGVYFYKMKASNYTATKKMILMK